MIKCRFFDYILPDEIVDFIYSTVRYEYPKELLEQIKDYNRISKFIRIFRNTHFVNKQQYFQDILIVYYSIQQEYRTPRTRYITYCVNNVPIPVWNEAFRIIENSVDSEKKIIAMCIKYMLKIPSCHLKYIFKQNRPRI